MKPKGCLAGIGVLLLVLLVFSFFLPKKMDLAVKKTLIASPEQVFTQVNNVKNWEHWSPWFKKDPNMTIVYSDNVVGEGASYTWKSKKRSVGTGTLVIEESVKDKMVRTTLMMEDSDPGHATFLIEPTPSGGSVVTWDFSSDYKAKMPWSRYSTTFMRKMLKRAYKKGLTAIDEYILDHPNEHIEQAADNARIEIRELEPIQAVITNRKGLISDMMSNGAQINEDAIAEVNKKVQEQGLTPVGYRFVIAKDWNEQAGTFDMDYAVQVESGGETLERGRMVVISYYGPHSGTGVAHGKVGNYIVSKGLITRGAPWEVYITDPLKEPDSKKWLTEIMYPIQ